MEFDIRSMKQRALNIMTTSQRSVWVVGAIWELLACLYMFLIILVCNIAQIQGILLTLIMIEIIYGFFRNSFKWYCMKAAREEKCEWTSILSNISTKPIGQVLLGIIKIICYTVGYACCWIGFFVPFYGFRFSIYIMKDEKVNPFQAISMSIRLLKGHLVELIKLDVSNLGWAALMICTLGVAGFFVKPYMSLIYTEFYDYLKGQYELLWQEERR